jgi:hypothetical protein
MKILLYRRTRHVLTGLALSVLSLLAQAQIQTKFQLTWTDHTNNPVDLQSPGTRAYMPYVLHDATWPPASRFRVWYDIASNSGLGYSESPDGLTWSAGRTLTGLRRSEDILGGIEFAGRPVVLHNTNWALPFRLYYYSRVDVTGDSVNDVLHNIYVAESRDGVTFTNNQVALDKDDAESRLGRFPDGHAVVWIPGRTGNAPEPGAERPSRPFVMYLRDRAGQGIALADSADGYRFAPMADDINTEANESLAVVQVFTNIVDDVPLDAPTNVSVVFPTQPTQVLRLAQNDFRMLAFEANNAMQYLVSADGLTWRVAENPIANIGSAGAGPWNAERNYYGAMAYLGDGRFYVIRGGREAGGRYLSGAAFADSAFYRTNDLGRWAFYSPFDNWQAEGWQPFTSSGNDVDGTETAVIQNADGSVSVRDRKPAGNFYLAHDTAWSVPFTMEFRSKLDDAQTTGSGTDGLAKYTIAAYMIDEFHPGPESWQPAFSSSRFGRWTLGDDTVTNAIFDLDGTTYHTYTVVCRIDEGARAELQAGIGGSAPSRLAYFEVYLDRDFSAPKATYFSTSFAGFAGVDVDGRLDIGFPGPSSGQVTVDWIRWGNGVILDAADPGAVNPTLSIARSATGVRITWTGGTLEASTSLGGWQPVSGATSPAEFPADLAARFFRVRR